MEYSKDEIERVLISNEEIQKRLDELAAFESLHWK